LVHEIQPIKITLSTSKVASRRFEKLGLATKPLLGKLLVGDSWSLKDLGREEEGGEEG
jgi:hypothetical protein